MSKPEKPDFLTDTPETVRRTPVQRTEQPPQAGIRPPSHATPLRALAEGGLAGAVDAHRLFLEALLEDAARRAADAKRRQMELTEATMALNAVIERALSDRDAALQLLDTYAPGWRCEESAKNTMEANGGTFEGRSRDE